MSDLCQRMADAMNRTMGAMGVPPLGAALEPPDQPEQLADTDKAPLSALLREAQYQVEQDGTACSREELEKLLRGFLRTKGVPEVWLEDGEWAAFTEAPE